MKAAQLKALFQKKPKLKKRLTILTITTLLLYLLYLLIPLPEPLFKTDYSTVVTDENGHILRAFLDDSQQWHFPPQKNNRHIRRDKRLQKQTDTTNYNEDNRVPEKLKKAVILFEDRHFYVHPGVNPVSLLRALFQNIGAGKVKSGASTISMQVIRLAFKRKRTLWNKAVEILQALKLELRYSKEDILRMYVQHAPYGGNIVGYTAASQKYFKRPPRQLTWSQAATLAVLPNAPGLISPMADHQSLIKKRNGLLKKLLEKKIIDKQTFQTGINEPVPRSQAPLFLNAPHLAGTLKTQFSKASGTIKTTILKEFQVPIEEMVKNHVTFLESMGIANAAVLVAETKTGKIRTYVGSQDFFDFAHGGQVDGVIAPRSTGSILKPFLYALAMDDGMILPSTMIRDIPSYFGSFSPSNMDKKYNGLVTAKEALIRSLNVPAVRLLNGYGIYKFYVFLKGAGMSTLFRQPDDYGLTLVLGGAEATLYELAAMYRALGNGGLFEPLILFADSQKEQGSADGLEGLGPGRRVQLLSPEACMLTLDMLKELKRPGAEYYWQQYQNQYPLAWKTGTSYGQRDAWAVGVSPRWTVAVWVGNFDGEGNSNISGAQCAAPLMLDIFNFLPKSEKENWFDASKCDFMPVEICMDTGFRAGPDCPRTFVTDSPGVKRPLRQCPFHKGIHVTKNEKMEVCSRCWERGNYKKISIAVYPPDVTQYLREAGVVVSKVPPHRRNCPTGQGKAGKPIAITYPVPNAKLWIPRDFDGHLQKVTLSVAHREGKIKIYWYMDNVYQGLTNEKHKMVFQLKKGPHTLEVVDEKGNRDRRQFLVQLR